MDPCIAYVSCADRHQIMMVGMDPESGALHDIATIDVPADEGAGSSMALALGPDRRTLYAAVRTGGHPLASFAIDARGMPSLLGVAPLADQMAYIATDRPGRHLLGASYGGAIVASYRVDARGMVRAPAVQILATPPCAHSIITDPGNNFVLAATLGGDAILRYAFTPTSGRLRALSPVATKPGSGPRHLRFSPDGRHVYLVNELDATVTAYRYDAATGALIELQSVSLVLPGVTGKLAAADLHITPDGCFLYASERVTNRLVGFAIDPVLGRLAEACAVPSPDAPRGFAIDPSGRFLLCAGQNAGLVVSYAIDRETGALERAHDHPTHGKPNWIAFLG
jgi:6-phosphogluconolactonase